MTRTGRQYGEYEVQELLGCGGMGEVYRAWQPKLRRHVALKFIGEEHTSDPVNRQRFLREIRACSQLSHPNIVKIYDSGVEDSDVYLVMEYLEGTPLESYIERAPDGLPHDFVLKVAEDVLSALAHVHPLGFVHRDIKPGNVMIGKFNRAVLMDFGLVKIAGDAQLTQVGRLIGTPRYLPPEALLGQVPDHRGDLYQVGLVICESLLGQLPFRQRDLLSFLRQERPDRPRGPRDERPGLGEPILALLDAAMSIDPDHRHPDAGTFISDLHTVKAGKVPVAPAERSQVGFPSVFPGVPIAARLRERYRFLAFVSRDPAVSVVAAHDRKRDRRVHLHFLPAHLTGGSRAPEALTKALETLVGLSHKALEGHRALGIDGETLYLAAPESTRATLASCLELQPLPGPEVVAAVVAELVAGLGHLHKKGLVHGYVSPASVRIDPSGQVVLVDIALGVLALQTSFVRHQDGVLRLGHFSSPAMLEGERPTAIDDAYSLAAVAYRLVTGDPPPPGARGPWHELPSATPPQKALCLILAQHLERWGRSDLTAGNMGTSPDLDAFARAIEKAAGGKATSAQVARELLPAAGRLEEHITRSGIGIVPGAKPVRTRSSLKGILAILTGAALGMMAGLVVTRARSTAPIIDLKCQAGEDTINVRFQTSTPVVTQVEVGPAGGTLETVTDRGAGARSDHRLVLKGLRPDTEYALRVGGQGPGAMTTTVRTLTFSRPAPAFAFRGLSASITWESPRATSAIVHWTRADGTPLGKFPLPSSTGHQVTLRGPGLVLGSSIVIVVVGDGGSSLQGPPLAVPGLEGRLGELGKALEARNPRLTAEDVRGLGELLDDPAASQRFRARLYKLLSAWEDSRWAAAKGPPGTEAPWGPLHRLSWTVSSVAGSVVATAQDLPSGGAPLWARTDADQPRHIPSAGRAATTIRWAGSPPVQMRLLATVDRLPPGHSLALTVNGDLELVLRPGAGSPPGGGPVRLAHNLDGDWLKDGENHFTARLRPWSSGAAPVGTPARLLQLELTVAPE